MFAKFSFVLITVFLVGFILLSGCVAPGVDESNLGTTKSNLTSSDGTNGGVDDQNGPSSCCMPMCKDAKEAYCTQVGGDPTGTSCDQVKECKTSCCTPMCKDAAEVYCTGVGGISTGKSCDQVQDCKVGCCTPFCKETTKAMCGEQGVEGIWQDKSCKDCPECNKICCSLGGKLTKTECEQLGGNEVDAKQCSVNGKITIELKHKFSCNCNKYDDPEQICSDALDLTQKYTAEFKFDNSENSGILGLGSGKIYHYKGKGTFTLNGNRDTLKSLSSTNFCYATKGNAAAVKKDESNFTYDGSVTGDVTANVREEEGKYYITYDIPYLETTAKEIWTRTTDSECPTDAPTSESQNFEHFVEGVISIDELTGLSGTKTSMQPPPEGAFACEDSNNLGTETIIWSFNLPD